MSKPTRRAAGGSARPGEAPTSAGASTPTSRPGGTRVGRRERARTGYSRRPFWDRYRGPILTLAVMAAVTVVGAFMVGQISAKSYTCTIENWNPSPRPSASANPSATPDYGLVQPDMGNSHDVSTPQDYTYCPPASGNHFNVAGRGPISARFYGRDDFTEPAGWIHNLEHGGLVILYRGREGDPGLTDELQSQMRAYWPNVPNSPVCGFAPGADAKVVIARFDDMAWPFAALVWGRVMPLETFDTDLIAKFWEAEGERTNPENRCPDKTPPGQATPTPAPSGSAAPSGSTPSGSVAPSGSPAASGGPAASPAASGSPAASPASS